MDRTGPLGGVSNFRKVKGQIHSALLLGLSWKHKSRHKRRLRTLQVNQELVVDRIAVKSGTEVQISREVV